MALADVKAEMVELLHNSNPDLGYGVAETAGHYKSSEYDAVILESDIAVAGSLLQHKNGRRAGFLVDALGIATGATLPSMPGPVETVACVITGGQRVGTWLVTPWPVEMFEELQREDRNPQGLTLIVPHCILDGSVIYHNKAGLVLAGATTVNFNVRHPALTLTAATQSPDELRKAVAALSLSVLQPKDGVRVEAANHWRNVANDELKRYGLAKAA